MLTLSVVRNDLSDLRSFVLTLPSIWVLSLAVRIAAQHFAIGSHSLEMETLLGPTGNISTDYEDLPPKQILRYSLAGQAATICLASLGALVTLALMPADRGHSLGSALLELPGGWGNRALAAQIMWVNVAIAVLNLLPTLPFDCRAVIYAALGRGQFGEEPVVLRKLAAFDSHLAVFFLGIGVTLFAVSFSGDTEYFGWYALVAAAVYLFVASRWESARSRQLEEQYMPMINDRQQSAHRTLGPPHLQIRGRRDASRGKPRTMRRVTHESSAELDVDEILRKLHREGTAALSVQEQEVLLSASQRLKEQKKQANPGN